ncbi:hypothetical protein AGABI2DRAFT_121348 [Agaricus bisporus var. bisporus H97]|uniref:hypothetical protein n=1 Tax=Agaricus bisporus var. bisporus (strain H97 / ATCC MYA-4626 / FGSC 10389) TaxID=936046 RepID=UPI00029F66CB|nr:hypothetical protein AGABI2DRAFT_121348 [Agaricus bisporus var. bisporus H97]EKV44156.1 hypothetical protein AGABI2DRAFT_121348 [Agaricus bisporus var. bisporus H97]
MTLTSSIDPWAYALGDNRVTPDDAASSLYLPPHHPPPVSFKTLSAYYEDPSRPAYQDGRFCAVLPLSHTGLPVYTLQYSGLPL